MRTYKAFVQTFAAAALAALFSTLTACGGGGESGDNSGSSVRPLAVEPKVTVLPVYGTLGSGPLVVVLTATEIQRTLNDSDATDSIVPRLLSAGYSVLTLDLPCHGADAVVGVKPLDCWSQRIAAGDRDIFLRFCAGLSDVLDTRGVSKAAILGVSRGAYVAMTCAAYDERFRDLVLEIPVTDLNYLTEFKATPVDESLFGTDQYVPYLTALSSLVRIGKADARVGTDLATAFANKLGAQLRLTDADGHSIAEDGSTITWLQAHPF